MRGPERSDVSWRNQQKNERPYGPSVSRRALRQREQSSALGDSPPAVPQQFFMLHHCLLHLGRQPTGVDLYQAGVTGTHCAGALPQLETVAAIGAGIAKCLGNNGRGLIAFSLEVVATNDRAPRTKEDAVRHSFTAVCSTGDVAHSVSVPIRSVRETVFTQRRKFGAHHSTNYEDGSTYLAPLPRVVSFRLCKQCFCVELHREPQ
jgi:hypothetical protein